MNSKNLIQEGNASLVASNARHREENAAIGRVVEWLEEQAEKKEKKNAEEQNVPRKNILIQYNSRVEHW